MNITEFIKMVEERTHKTADPYELFLMIKNDDKLAQQLCEAAVRTKNNLEHVKQFIG